MDYEKISQETVTNLYRTYHSLKKSPLNATIRSLLELRISQINGCEYCCEVHTQDAKKAQVTQEKIDALVNWQSSQVFSDAERAALKTSEDLTILREDVTHVVGTLSNHFSERECVDIILCISVMNALNRIAMSLRD